MFPEDAWRALIGVKRDYDDDDDDVSDDDSDTLKAQQ